MKKYYSFIGTLILFIVSFTMYAQISPTSSPYYADGPYSITADSTTVSSKKVVMYHPVTAPTGNKYPVFIFQPGANGFFSSAITVHSYDLYLKHLASYGYVVLVIDETSAGMPNGTTFKAVHDWFKTNVANTSHWLYTYADPTKVAVGGHSNGGVNASGCLVDRPAEINAIVYFASYPSNNFLVTQDVSGYTGSVLDLSGADDATSTPADCRTGYDSFTSANCAFWVSITGMDHGGFGDYVNADQPVGSIGRTNATATVRHYLVSYLEYIFKNNTVAQANFQSSLLQPNTTNEYENSCITTSVPEDESYSGINLFPNPFNSVCTIVASNKIDMNEISIIDITGREITEQVMISVLSETSVSLDFSEINNGMYLMYINGSEEKPIRINVVH
jgi:hypothetical protein